MKPGQGHHVSSLYVPINRHYLRSAGDNCGAAQDERAEQGQGELISLSVNAECHFRICTDIGGQAIGACTARCYNFLQCPKSESTSRLLPHLIRLALLDMSIHFSGPWRNSTQRTKSFCAFGCHDSAGTDTSAEPRKPTSLCGYFMMALPPC